METSRRIRSERTFFAAAALGALALGAASAAVVGPRAIAAPAVTLVASAFDADSEGWTIIGEAVGPTFGATGRKPGGFVSAADPQGSSGTSYWRAPSKFSGDRSAAFGKKLKYAIRDVGGGSFFREQDVIVAAGALELGYSSRKKPKGSRWTKFSVRLDGRKGWRVTETGAKATADQMRTVLAGLDFLAIRGEYRNGPETLSIDSVTLTGANEM